jgi:membrane protein
VWAEIKRGVSDAGKAWLHFECTSMAAGVAFYAGLSLFPLMLVLIAGIGSFFEVVQRGRDARGEILTTVSQQFSPQVAEALGGMLNRVEAGAPVAGPVAGVALIFTASVVFLHIDRGFNRIWEVRKGEPKTGFRRTLKRLVAGRLRSLAMLFGTGLVVVLVFTAGLAMRAANAIMNRWFPAAGSFPGFGTVLVGLAVNALVFFLLYRFLSKEKVGNRLCLATGIGTALFWEIGNRGMSALSFGSGFSVYGVIGSFLLVQVWIYYNAMVMFAGAVVVRVLAKPPGDADAGPA